MLTLEDVNYLHGALDAIILDCYLGFNYPTGAGQLQVPFWVIGYWRMAYDIVEAKRVWLSVLERLEKAGGKDLLACIPWGTTLSLSIGMPQVEHLADYCSTQWLSSSHMDQMSTILNATLAKSGCPMLAINTKTVGKLISLFRYE